MIYLIEQLFWFLCIALCTGVVVGWVTYRPGVSDK